METNAKELNDLIELVDSYKIENGKLAQLKKDVDITNKKIKEAMVGLKLSNVITPKGIKATLNEQDRASINSDLLVVKLKEIGALNAVKVIEVPDDAIIEKMIYDEQMDPQIVADCTSHKIIQVLKVK